MKGKLTSAAAVGGTYVSFSFINTANSALKFNFKVLVAQGSVEFVLNIDTRKTAIGDYYLAFYSGLSGAYSTSYVYTVRSQGTEPSAVAAPATPTGCSLELVDNRLVLKWNEDNNTPVEKVTFTQAGKTPVEYIFSNFQSSFIILNKDFVNFAAGSVTVTIASAYSSIFGLGGRLSPYSSPWTYTFKAGSHAFSDAAKAGITFSAAIPWRVPTGSSITIQGTSTVQLYNTMVVE